MGKRNIIVPVVDEGDFETVGDESDVDASAPSCKVSIHQLPASNGAIVKVVPPSQPIGGQLEHVPSDIVLVLDVSGSMGARVNSSSERDRNGKDKSEENWVTILDLTKHAAKTIIESLDEHDRLSLVTFSTEVIILSGLTVMNSKNKELAKDLVQAMIADGFTYLWNGIKVGLNQFQSTSEKYAGNLRSVMVLTDGKPYGGTGSSPPEGHIPAMRKLGKLPAPVHTFGFGYELDPGLLQSIAAYGGGKYSYIADSSTLGTVFIHATANLQSTYARRAELVLRYPSILMLEEKGTHINKHTPKPIVDQEGGGDDLMELIVDLNNIKYGQSREIYLPYGCSAQDLANQGVLAPIQATIQYTDDRNRQNEATCESQLRSDAPCTLSESEIVYQLTRSLIVEYISNLFPINTQGEHRPLMLDAINSGANFETFVNSLPAKHMKHINDSRITALMHDLIGDGTEQGQVALSLTPKFYSRWGQHFLPSLMEAHRYQMRISFTDPGTQVYGAQSEMFLHQVEALNTAFGKMEMKIAPPPVYNSQTRQYVKQSPVTVRASAFNDVNRVCFAGGTRVQLAATRGFGNDKKKKTVAMEDLRPGMTVRTPKGPRRVETVLRCHTDKATGRTICRLGAGAGGLLVTPWHPVSLNGGRTWIFPGEMRAQMERIDGFMKDVYAVQLECRGGRDTADAHAINVDGVWGVTMGHGLVGTGEAAHRSDIRNHAFYGDHSAVATSLKTMPRNEYGVALIGGTMDDPETGLVASFLALNIAKT